MARIIAGEFCIALSTLMRLSLQSDINYSSIDYRE